MRLLESGFAHLNMTLYEKGAFESDLGAVWRARSPDRLTKKLPGVMLSAGYISAGVAVCITRRQPAIRRGGEGRKSPTFDGSVL